MEGCNTSPRGGARAKRETETKSGKWKKVRKGGKEGAKGDSERRSSVRQ